MDRAEDGIDAFLRRAVHLVHDADVRHAQVRLARVVAELVSGTMRIDDDDVEVGLDERRVVVAAVPEDDVRFLLRRAQDALVVDAREDEVALGEMRLVLLALLDRRVRCLEILIALEPLYRLFRQIAVRHGMAQHGDALPGFAEQFGDAPSRLALARARADSADRHRRLRGSEHRLPRRDQLVRRAGRERARADVHDVFVRDVGVGEDDDVDLVFADELLQRRLRQDRNSFRIQRPRQLGGVAAVVDVRDLRRGERDDLVGRTVPVDEVEVVEVAAGCPCDQDSSPGHA